MLYRAREREIEHTLVGKGAVVVISLPEAALGRVWVAEHVAPLKPHQLQRSQAFASLGMSHNFKRTGKRADVEVPA